MIRAVTLLSGLLGGAAFAACDAGPPPRSTLRAAAPVSKPADSSAQASAALPHASLEYVEIMTGGARVDEAVPLVVALHGLGDNPEHFLSVFTGFQGRARIVAPHSEMAWGAGYTWFEGGGDLTDRSAPMIAKMATTVVHFATEMSRLQPTLGKPIIMGFSQGGALAFEIEVHHADAVAAAFPVGGWLTPALWPIEKPPSAVSITAFHGTADERVPFDATKAAVARLRQLGFPIELHEYPGVGHGIPPAEGRDLIGAITAECEKQRQAGPSLLVQH